jgi:hypothetical protein
MERVKDDDAMVNQPQDGSHTSSTRWVRKLFDCPCVTVLDAAGPRVPVEVAGLDGWAWHLEGGLCFGLRIDIAQPSEQWVNETTLYIAASFAACDGALSQADGKWVLWHRYDHEVDAAQLHERLGAQVALVRRLAESAQPLGSTSGSEIGRFI